MELSIVICMVGIVIGLVFLLAWVLVKKGESFMVAANQTPGSVISSGVLPNGTKVLACKKDAIPGSWPYKYVSEDGNITPVLLNIVSGNPYTKDWSVRISHADDQLLWIANLTPGAWYKITFNGKNAIGKIADSAGRIFLGDIPIPMFAMKGVDILISGVEPIEPTSGSYPYVTSVPTKDYSVSHRAVRVNNYQVMRCPQITKERSLVGIYQQLPEKDKREIASGHVPIMFVNQNQDSSVNAVSAVIRGGNIVFK